MNEQSESTALTQQTERPSYLVPIGESRRGYDAGVDDDDKSIPRVKILQSLSPEVTEDESGTFKPGLMINSVSREIYPENLEFMAVHHWKEWIKWIPRDEGGGIQWRCINKDDPRVREEGVWINGTPPTAPPYLHFLAIPTNTEQPNPVVISFAKTNYNAGKQLLNTTLMAGGDMFSKKYAVCTNKETNKHGTFFVAKIRPIGWVSEEEYKVAILAYETVVPGLVSGLTKADVKD